MDRLPTVSYRSLVALSNQFIIVLGVDLQDRRLLGIYASLGSGERRQQAYRKSAEGGVVHDGLRMVWSGLGTVLRREEELSL